LRAEKKRGGLKSRRGTTTVPGDYTRSKVRRKEKGTVCEAWGEVSQIRREGIVQIGSHCLLRQEERRDRVPPCGRGGIGDRPEKAGDKRDKHEKSAAIVSQKESEGNFKIRCSPRGRRDSIPNDSVLP